MQPSSLPRNMLMLVAGILSACGGGGGGGSDAGKPVPVNTSIMDATAAPSFNFSTFKTSPLRASALLQAAGGFTVTDASKTYIKVWYLDTSGQRQQLMFMTLAALQAKESTGGIEVKFPGDMTVLKFEIYDATTNKSGEVMV